MIQIAVQLAISLDTLKKQTFLSAERGVKACDIHPDHLCQHGHGCAFIPMLPEQFERRIQGFRLIEISWSSPLHGFLNPRSRIQLTAPALRALYISECLINQIKTEEKQWPM